MAFVNQRVVRPRVIPRTTCSYCCEPLKSLEIQQHASLCVECEKARARYPVHWRDVRYRAVGKAEPVDVTKLDPAEVFKGFQEGDD